jgi:hypothetical protein
VRGSFSISLFSKKEKELVSKTTKIQAIRSKAPKTSPLLEAVNHRHNLLGIIAPVVLPTLVFYPGNKADL